VKFAVVVFPGSNSDYDAFYAASRVVGEQAELVWHKDTDLKGADAVILPGGFAHGDYLRTGAIARFSPIMAAVRVFADRGGPVLGICNGFQILLEAGLLPGAMVRNDRIKFVSQLVPIRVEQTDTPFTAACTPKQVLMLPIAHGEGNYYAPPEQLAELESNRQVIFRYASGGGEVGTEWRHLQSSAQCRWLDAASRARIGAGARQRRWPRGAGVGGEGAVRRGIASCLSPLNATTRSSRSRCW
jgi:phosphoribosylformylglycinamidine synthase